VAWLLFPGVPASAVPTGMNPYIYGMHDDPGSPLLDGANNCGRGWVTELQYIGWGGTCGGFDRSARAAAGIGTIMRLDSGGSPQLPTDPNDYDAFAQTFAQCVLNSQGIRVWIVGNEPNLNWGYQFSPQEYGEIYHRVIQAVKALPGGVGYDHEILFASPGIWANVQPWGNWDDGLQTALQYVLAKPNGRVDGASIHAYTRGHETAYVTSDEWFPGFTNKWHLHFRIYRDFLRVYSDVGLLGMPLYITEAGSVCDPPCDPYDDVDKGYFLAMYEEIYSWNQAHPQQVIRAVTPYRWTLNDDNTGRDFCIGCSAPLVQDMSNAIAMGRKWDNSGCHEPFATDGGVDAGGSADAQVGLDGASPADGSGPVGDGGTGGDAASPGPDGSGSGSDDVATGCNCRTPSSGAPLPWLLLVGVGLFVTRRRARRRHRRSAPPAPAPAGTRARADRGGALPGPRPGRRARPA